LSEKQATVHINKILAAKRQLGAAIRLYFIEEDELAIHTIASAAFRILRDVLKSRQVDSLAAEMVQEGLYVLGRQLAEQTISEEKMEFLKADRETFATIEKIADEIKKQGVNFDRNQIGIKHSSKEDQRAWLSKAANFLKHADRDLDELLDLDEVKNEELLMGACCAYIRLMKKPTPEITVFFANWLLNENREDCAAAVVEELCSELRQTPTAKRRQVCREMIQRLKQGPEYATLYA